ncbi:MAG: hypothetical protein JSW65_04800 [Candidatus Bipolaricaulota bacterium]|nr:MAG: hypothetical protein JSW65_04800 [Candidatus Bipolaricaulota bacterium]
MARTGRETDLFDPVRRHLEAQGFTVRAEVEHCDVVAYRAGVLVVVELKQRFGVDLLMQATSRQRITEHVYVAVPGASLRDRRRRRRTERLLRRLELGLILVNDGSPRPTARTIFDPSPYRQRRPSRLRSRVLEEMIGRTDVRNEGGATRRKLMTAYRENALQIACFLATVGPLSPKELRDLGCGARTAPILQRNVYGWFRRLERGLYDVTPEGRRAIEEHPDVAADYLRPLKEADGRDAPSRPFAGVSSDEEPVQELE